MPISLHVLGEASAGPAPNGNRPTMLSAGDSLMWGQGLRPDHKFRELVRTRLAQEGAPVVELALGRSGAKLDPQNNPGVAGQDAAISATLYTDPQPPLDPLYWPGQFAREVPWPALTTRQQLTDANRLLQGVGAAASPLDIRWIILDGGINDVGINGILSPIPAYNDGYFLEGWSAWILDKCRQIEGELVATVRQALDQFPNAVIVVNGYFPVFSYWSLGNLVRLQSVGLLYGIANLVMLTGVGLDALATASSTWQAASNKHLRRAIQTVTGQRPGRTVLFARSNIEEEHSLFAPDTWLWGYDAIPDGVPTSVNQWVQWLAAATPEDEVIAQRLIKCADLAPAPGDAIPCRLASIGHPNVAGAQDYATAIIEALEDAGIIRSSLDECALGGRRRKNGCTSLEDDWAYECARADANLGKACGGTVRGVGGAALDQFREAGSSLTEAGDHVNAAGACFTKAGAAGRAAQGLFGKAAGNLAAAGDHLDAAATCWDETAQEIQACDNTEATDIASCNAAYHQADVGACNIQCNSYTHCRSSYGKWDPRRYTCLAARGVCVAAAATARAACLAGAVTILGACKAAAGVKSAACKAAVAGGNVICSGSEVAQAAGDVLVAGTEAALGGAAAVGQLGSDGLCALGELGKAGVDVGKAAGHGLAGVGLSILTGGIYLGCLGLGWVTNRSCRLLGWGGGKLCRFGNILLTGSCYLTWPVRALGRRIA